MTLQEFGNTFIINFPHNVHVRLKFQLYGAYDKKVTKRQSLT